MFTKTSKQKIAPNFLRHNSVPKKSKLSDNSMEFRLLRKNRNMRTVQYCTVLYRTVQHCTILRLRRAKINLFSSVPWAYHIQYCRNNKYIKVQLFLNKSKFARPEAQTKQTIGESAPWGAHEFSICSARIGDPC